MGLRPTQGDEKRGLDFPVTHRTVIPTEAKRSGGTCCSADLSWKCFSTERSGVERSAVLSIPQADVEWKHRPYLVIPSAAEGPAVLRTFPGNVFRQSVAESRDLLCNGLILE